MAYNYYPQLMYQPYQQQQIPQQQMPMLPQMQSQNQQLPVPTTVQTPQIQNGGFVLVPNENIAYNYPVAPGNCVTFKIEGQPIVIEKSMGFSQIEPPKIERYRLTKEDLVEQPHEDENTKEIITFAEQSEVDDIKDLMDSIKDEIKILRADVNKLMSVKRVKKEVIIEDDAE